MNTRFDSAAELAQALRLLERLHVGGDWWLYSRPHGRGYESDWRRAGPHRPPRAAWLAHDDVFFGVHPHVGIPTTNAQGKRRDQRWVRGTVHNLAAANALFVELDAKDTISEDEWLPFYVTPDVAGLAPGQARGALQKAQTAAIDAALPLRLAEYKARALAAVLAAPLRPSALWDSGGGYQGVWLLAAGIPLRDADDRHTGANPAESRLAERNDPAAPGGDGGVCATCCADAGCAVPGLATGGSVTGGSVAGGSVAEGSVAAGSVTAGAGAGQTAASAPHPADFAQLQKEWVRCVGGDPAASDLNRVLRLPGSINRKPKYGPAGHGVSFLWCDLDCVYPFAGFATLLASVRPESALPGGSGSSGLRRVYVPPGLPPALGEFAPVPRLPRDAQLDAYNAATDLRSLLLGYGYTPAGAGRLNRPGGTTAGVQLHADNTATIYSSADPLWCGHRITPAHALCVFDYDGNVTALLTALTHGGQLPLFA
jgi:hypothetical protein